MSDKVDMLVPDIGEIPSVVSESPNSLEWRDGLLVRSPNWLGDIIMTLPAMLQLKLLLPETCGLFVVCPRGLAPIFEAMNIVDTVIGLDDAHSFLPFKKWNSVRHLHCAAAVIFNNSLRDAISLKSTLIPKLYGASARGRSFLLTRSISFPKRRDFVFNPPHHASRYLAIAKMLGAPDWEGYMPEMNPQIEPELLSPCVREVLRHDNLMIIAAGAAYGDAKCWPFESYRAVAENWIGRGGVVVSVGSKGERDVAEGTIAGLSDKKAFCLAGETSLEELMLILKRSAIVIANDSGVMHLAAALGAKGVAIFGSTDYVATSPLSKDWRILYHKLPCSPCFKRNCPKGTKECFKLIAPEMVLDAMKDLGVSP